MRTFTEQEAKELLCPMKLSNQQIDINHRLFNAPDSVQIIKCVGVRCVAFTESSERYDVQSGRDVLDFYCAAMPGNRE